MGAKAQAEAYEKLAQATEEERKMFQEAYDEAFGPGSYNAKVQELGQKAGQQYYDMVNDKAAWDRYLTGEKAYTAPQDFSFTENDFTDDPSYKVRLQEGLDALDQSNVANGLNLSGAAVKATNDYAQDQASKEYAAAYGRKFNEYRDKRDFDFNAWKAEADRYYNNLLTQLNGIGNVSNQGIAANTNQSNALAALAGQKAAATQQQATAQGAQGMAETAQLTSVLDALSKGLSMGAGMYASQSGATATPTNTTPTSGTYTVQQGLNNGGQDFARTFLAGWSPSTNTTLPTTQNLIGV
jgi:hypothetical protein